jgi:hypothetical protein
MMFISRVSAVSAFRKNASVGGEACERAGQKQDFFMFGLYHLLE